LKTLYPFQEECVQKAQGQPGFLNACDMGTGKTIITLEEMRRAEAGTSLIVAVGDAAKMQWAQHCRDFGVEPHVMTSTYQGPLWSSFERAPEPRILITHWGNLPRMVDAYSSLKWDYVVADEAHYAKNRKAQRTVALKKIPALRKRALTGTPIANKPWDLWSILNWLYPRHEWFRGFWKFYREFVDYDIRPDGYHNIFGPQNEGHLRMLIAPLYYRKEFGEVFPEFPEPHQEVVPVELSKAERRMYDDMREDALAWVGLQGDEALPATSTLAQLTRLRQMATGLARIEGTKWVKRTDPEGNVSMEEVPVVRIGEPSSKIKALAERIEGTDAKVGVFSQFKDTLRMMAERARKMGISYVMHTGPPDCTSEDRVRAVKKFRFGDVQLFLATSETGGVSLDLYESHHCVLIDKNWRPDKNDQTIRRFHRHGQQNRVHVMELQAEDTVDQVVEETLQMKKEWIRRMLGGRRR
jgi:SNF2 family DNA or RNA helicase